MVISSFLVIEVGIPRRLRRSKWWIILKIKLISFFRITRRLVEFWEKRIKCPRAAETLTKSQGQICSFKMRRISTSRVITRASSKTYRHLTELQNTFPVNIELKVVTREFLLLITTKGSLPRWLIRSCPKWTQPGTSHLRTVLILGINLRRISILIGRVLLVLSSSYCLSRNQQK